MGKLTKNQRLALSKIEVGKMYTLKQASILVKEITTTKFNASVGIDVCLGIDSHKVDQMVRGVVSFPHGIGKQIKILALVTPDQEGCVQSAGADYVGMDEYINKIESGWTDVDVIVTQPVVMEKIGFLGRILGPRGLMPNPQNGTITDDVVTAVKEIKQGKMNFKVDKGGIVHVMIGKVSFSSDQIYENARTFIDALIKVKPIMAKGLYIKSMYLSSTMSLGLKIDPKFVEKI